jgi:hypothetical protein
MCSGLHLVNTLHRSPAFMAMLAGQIAGTGALPTTLQ